MVELYLPLGGVYISLLLFLSSLLRLFGLLSFPNVIGVCLFWTEFFSL